MLYCVTRGYLLEHVDRLLLLHALFGHVPAACWVRADELGVGQDVELREVEVLVQLVHLIEQQVLLVERDYRGVVEAVSADQLGHSFGVGVEPGEPGLLDEVYDEAPVVVEEELGDGLFPLVLLDDVVGLETLEHE